MLPLHRSRKGKRAGLRTIAAFVFAAAMLPAVTSAAADPRPTDEELLRVLRDAVAQSRILTPDDNVHLHVVNGNAVVTGTVAVWEEVDQLKELLSRTPGVRGVVASVELQRRPAPAGDSASD